MAAAAQVQAEATREERAGIEHAKGRDEAYRGRNRNFTQERFVAVTKALAVGERMSDIATVYGLTRQTVYRIRDNPAEAEAALARWA